MKYCISLIVLFSLFTRCGSPDKFKSKPTAFGPLNQVNVITDKYIWENMKDTFLYYFETPYPLMPAPEPVFDVRHFTPEDLRINKSRRKLRTYMIMATLDDTSSQTLKLIQRDLKNSFTFNTGENGYNLRVGEDKWAKNQKFIYVYANTDIELKTAIAENFPKLAGQIRSFDKEALDAKIYTQGENKSLMQRVNDSFGIHLRLPSKTQISPTLDSNFMWLRIETKEASQSILISKFAYKSRNQFDKEAIINLRNTITSKYIDGSEENSYMLIDDINLPVLYGKEKIGVNTAYELRGIWQMENAFQGGPFVTYLILDPNLESLYFVDLFVYAPGEEKRDFMQELEHIASTLKI